MNKTILFALISAYFSTPALADTQNEEYKNDRSGFYMSAGSYAHTIKVVGEDISPEQAFALNAGYDFKASGPLIIGLDLEYTTPSEYYLKYNNNFISYDYSALSLSVKPKYYIQSSGFYIAGIVGYTKHKIESTIMHYGNKLSGTGSGSDISYGIEAGYEFDSGILMKASYRKADADINTISTKISTVGINVGYKF